MYAVSSGKTKSSTVQISTVERATVVMVFSKDLVGGRIYYVDSSASGGEYHFYNANLQELTTYTVDGLADAVYYDVKSKANKDKFYVYATNNGSPSDSILVGTYLKWSLKEISQSTEDKRGSGKTNSATLLNKYGSDSNTIWNWLKGLRNSNLNGCNDWFIGSKVELDDLRTGGTRGASIFSDIDIWSSVQYGAEYAHSWPYYSSSWTYSGKTSPLNTVALRAF